jgi:hypothetical protein
MAKNNKGKTALDFYGTSSTINPPLSAEVKKQRSEELKAAFLEAKDRKIVSLTKENASLTKEIAVLIVCGAGGLVYAACIVLFRAVSVSELKTSLKREPGAATPTGLD